MTLSPALPDEYKRTDLCELARPQAVLEYSHTSQVCVLAGAHWWWWWKSLVYFRLQISVTESTS